MFTTETSNTMLSTTETSNTMVSTTETSNTMVSTTESSASESTTTESTTTTTTISAPASPEETIILEGDISLTMTVTIAAASWNYAIAKVLINAIADQFSTIDSSNFVVVSITCISRRARNRYLSSRSVLFAYRFSLSNVEASAQGETANTWQENLMLRR